jgi:hypothetical protein
VKRILYSYAIKGILSGLLWASIGFGEMNFVAMVVKILNELGDEAGENRLFLRKS